VALVGIFPAVFHGFEAQLMQPEKAGRKIFGVRSKECLGRWRKDTLRA
jgi:hypothetical protein